MESIKIKDTEVIFQNYGPGEGKIIISNLYRGSFSYYWGSMGSTLEEFILSINNGYFADKLCNDRFVFSGKRTAQNIRRHIREELKWDLPWYKFQSAQKELREILRDLEQTENKYEALSFIESIPNKLYCFDLDSYDEREFKSIIEDMVKNEPWYYLGEELSPEYKFLVQLHKDLKKVLQKAKNKKKVVA